jgi:hypothetical protein
MQSAEPLRHLLDAHAWDEVRLPVGGVQDLLMLLEMPPCAQSESANKEQENAQAKQLPPRPATPVCAVWWRHCVAIRCRERRPGRRPL